MLQCSVRQICHPTNVRLLSQLGAQLGVQEKGKSIFEIEIKKKNALSHLNLQAILDEIRHYSADIISLQEIETDQFYNFFKPELKNDGYEGIFSPKSRAKTMGENERKYVDGCAIFYRTSKYDDDDRIKKIKFVNLFFVTGSHYLRIISLSSINWPWPMPKVPTTC